ncbi:MAG TPA: PhzF family phenazine biosynthesis protein [Afifellaceae bacterium]|nr:PhzF family phenazine biosynthesis protein [Afifellaceae bacterium]
MPRRFCIYDVFTDKVLSGNPLAIVHDAEGLGDEEMQAIAGEFNLSETVFVFPAEGPAHSAAIRIFTPRNELPFAGHPTVGTAVCLAGDRLGDVGGPHDAVIVLEEVIGAVRCGVRIEGTSGFAEFDIPQMPQQIACDTDKSELAEAVGLKPADITFENHRPERWSAGVEYNFVPVRNLSALASAKPNHILWNEVMGERGAYLYTRETVGHNHHFSARMFWPGGGIGEDPATGSAAAAFASVIHRFDGMPDGDHEFIIEQGYEMGRPSKIRLECTAEGGQLQRVRIGGHAVKVAEGNLDF